jgi:diguanylate cyclase (GGDEF)-like protein/PAS domain S-box-containing protein
VGRFDSSRRRYALECAAVFVVVGVWFALTGANTVGKLGARNVSDVGLVLAAFGASVACISNAGTRFRHRRVWLLLGLSAGSWGVGQVVWTYYEVIAGRQVPFPSIADIGYLTAVPLAAAGLLMLPSGTRSMAGRLRTLLDGLLIAGSVLLISWQLVLVRVYQARTGHLFTDVVSLSYPIGDVVIVTIVAYAVLRARQSNERISAALAMVGFALFCLAVADSGFAYLTATNSYSSGNVIDTGWFAGYLLLLLAARTPSARRTDWQDSFEPARPKGILLPFVAVLAALATSVEELARGVHSGPFVAWTRSTIIALLVGRQILTVRENVSLTKDLEIRVVQLRASEQRFEALVQQSSDVVTLVDAEGVVLYQSESVFRHFGYPASSIKGHPISDVFTDEGAVRFRETLAHVISHPDEVTIVELPVRHSSSRLCHAEVAVANLLANPNVQGIVLNIRDMSERKALSDQLLHQAHHDSLTELANRALFRDHLEQVVCEDRARSPRGAVLFLDLDGFKEINDSLGHAAGDLLLAQVAERLQSCVRPGDMVARLGGDEFGVLTEGVESIRDAHALAIRILSALNQPFTVESGEVHVRASIGIATTEPGVENADQLLRNADLAMYRAKTLGGGMVERYIPEMHVELLQRIELEGDLRRAIGRGELRLHYQPVVELASCATTGFEALIRWNHPDKGVVSPKSFIGTAERTGLIQPIGRWVLHEGCRQAVIWHEQHPDRAPLTVSVNISARQLERGDLIDDVANALRESGLPPQCLVLEMTESVLVEHTETNLEHVRTLKGMGIRLAIDDFGTGYSSLAYLHRFPVDILKIDSAFINRLNATDRDLELVRNILQIGRSLRMATVAEGIETEEQRQMLSELGCEFGQGFYFARPMPPGDTQLWLQGAERAAVPAE